MIQFMPTNLNNYRMCARFDDWNQCMDWEDDFGTIRTTADANFATHQNQHIAEMWFNRVELGGF